MEAPFPEKRLLEVIWALEENTMISPNGSLSAEARNLKDTGVRLKREGNLYMAHACFLEMYKVMQELNSDAFWSWAKVLLLSKDFKYAQMLMHVAYAGERRGTRTFNPFYEMNSRLQLPGFGIDMDVENIEQYYDVPLGRNNPVISLNYFEDPQQLVNRIFTYGGNPTYWAKNYTWDAKDYSNFISYFGPQAFLVAANAKYSWTADDGLELQESYKNIIAGMQGQVITPNVC